MENIKVFPSSGQSMSERDPGDVVTTPRVINSPLELNISHRMSLGLTTHTKTLSHTRTLGAAAWLQLEVWLADRTGACLFGPAVCTTGLGTVGKVAHGRLAA